MKGIEVCLCKKRRWNLGSAGRFGCFAETLSVYYAFCQNRHKKDCYKRSACAFRCLTGLNRGSPGLQRLCKDVIGTELLCSKPESEVIEYFACQVYDGAVQRSSFQKRQVARILLLVAALCRLEQGAEQEEHIRRRSDAGECGDCLEVAELTPRKRRWQAWRRRQGLNCFCASLCQAIIEGR